MAEPDIRFLFEPRGVAVVGASQHPDKIGYKVLENVVKGGYSGGIYPVNPGGGEILGKKAYGRVEEIPGDVDVACIVIPAKFVFDSIKGCAAKGVKFAIIISSGFSDVGNIEEEKKIVAYAREHGMRIIGPNVFGVYSGAVSLNSTFGAGEIRKGGVAIITQSGALGLAMIGRTSVENIGLSAIVSVGNKSDIDESDLLGYLVEQDATKVILMYMEGVRNGEKLTDALKKATKRKPVVVIKSGRSERGAIAAASHTGSLAGSDGVFRDIIAQCGVLRAESVKEAFSWCKFLANSPIPTGEGTLILTNGGGVGVMAADACEKYGVNLFDDTKTLKGIFAGVIPDFGSTKNPVDLTGQATSVQYNSALEAALRHPDISSVIALYCETAVFDSQNLGAMIEDNYRKYQAAGKPIIFSIFGGERTENCSLSLRDKPASVFSDVYDAVSCVGTLYAHRKRLLEPQWASEDAKIDAEAIDRIVEAAIKGGRGSLLVHEAKEVMRAAGIRIPKGRIAHGLEDTIRASEEIGYPVVLKVVSKDILHKSDVGGVALRLDNKSEVMDGFEVIMHNCKTRAPGAMIEGIEVSEMVERGTELIVGARKDGAFGPIAMFGLGGIYVEVLKDVSFRAIPLSRQEAMRMMKETKAYPLLLGVRGEERKDVDAVVEAITRIGAVVRKCRGVSDIEVNPLVAYAQGEGVTAVDARVLLKVERGGANE